MAKTISSVRHLENIGRMTFQQLDRTIDDLVTSLAPLGYDPHRVTRIDRGVYQLEPSSCPFDAYWAQTIVRMTLADAGIPASRIEQLMEA